MIVITPKIKAVFVKIMDLENNPDASLRESMEAVRELQQLEARLIDENVMKSLMSILSKKELTPSELSELKSFCLEGIIESVCRDENLAYKMLGKAILETERRLDSGIDLNTSLEP